MPTSKTARKSALGKRPARRQSAAKKSRRNTTKKAAVCATRPGSKQADLIALLERPAGATIAQMCTKTGWQAHSVRAALTGLRKRGLAVTRTKNESGLSIYRVGRA
jgi:Protein of unknown function (DUF3489)